MTTELDSLLDADLILSGASSQKGFLNSNLFKKNAVIVDVAVPANISPEELAKLQNSRPDLTYVLGGKVKLPSQQKLTSALFPLPAGESFACMAETFALGFYPELRLMNIGNLHKEQVLQTEKLIKDLGFEMGSFKTKNSL